MRISNENELHRLEKTERYRPYLYTTFLIIGLIAVFFAANSHFERRAAIYKNSTKVPVMGTFKSFGSGKHGSFCFFDITGYAVTPVRCSSAYYKVGEKVQLIKITQSSGNVSFEVSNDSRSLTHPSSGTR